MPVEDIAREYLQGGSIKGIGKRIHASQALITRCLRNAGVTPRTGAETEHARALA